MDKACWIVCNAFLQKAGKEKSQALLRFLPSSTQEVLKALPQTQEDPSLGFEEISSILDKVHPSWLTPFFRNLSESDARLFLSCLSDPVAKKLQKSLLFSGTLVMLSPQAKSYLQKTLFDHLLSETEGVLPAECLPKSDLSILMTLSSDQLRLLIEFLGLHDLSVEIRQIIDTTKLNKINTVLSKEKQSYLKMLLQSKEPVVFKRMELSKWDGKPETLLKVLYLRGLNRLAKALHDEHSSLLWYVSHKLPWEEAAQFSSLCKGLEHPKAASILSKQILDLVSVITTSKP